MFRIFLICLITAASAAPHSGHGHHHYQHGDFEDFTEDAHRPSFGRRPPPPPYPGFGESVFDTKAFWGQLEAEMRELDDILKNFNQRFPSSVSGEGIEGNMYKITIALPGYKEEEVSVKARAGLLMIQAVQNSGNGRQRSYLDLRTLPDGIELSGTWTYDKDVLIIQFPVKKAESATEVAATEIWETDLPTTESPDRSREEMGHDDNTNPNVDVGNRGDNDQDKEIETNEIPDKQIVEATTYAVDLKNEVEFVPVNY